MPELLLSTTVLASFIGGVLALLARCCVSVMLPAYFASSFRRRTQLLSFFFGRPSQRKLRRALERAATPVRAGGR